MKTLKKSKRLFYAANTDSTPGVPVGKVHVHLVQYETIEMDRDEFEKTNFSVHDLNCKEAQTIIGLAAPSINREDVADELEVHSNKLGAEAGENQKIGNIKSFIDGMMDAVMFLKVSQWLRRK